MQRILSRKFLVSIGAIGSIIISAINGAVEWSAALPSISAIAIGYCVSQGWGDGKMLEQQMSKTQEPKEDKGE